MFGLWADWKSNPCGERKGGELPVTPLVHSDLGLCCLFHPRAKQRPEENIVTWAKVHPRTSLITVDLLNIFLWDLPWARTCREMTSAWKKLRNLGERVRSEESSAAVVGRVQGRILIYGDYHLNFSKHGECRETSGGLCHVSWDLCVFRWGTKGYWWLGNVFW